MVEHGENGEDVQFLANAPSTNMLTFFSPLSASLDVAVTVTKSLMVGLDGEWVTLKVGEALSI